MPTISCGARLVLPFTAISLPDLGNMRASTELATYLKSQRSR